MDKMVYNCLMATKKVTKKSAKKVVKADSTETKGATYNEYGVCIECQGGDPDCHHNNLVATAEGTFCALCGLRIPL